MQNVLTIDPLQEAVGLSIQGPRDRQEDTAVLVQNRYAVFDGLGGSEGGEVASMAGAQGFAEPAADLYEAIDHAVQSVRKAQQKAPRALTTFVAVEVLPTEIRFAWAGDSRMYLFHRLSGRGGTLDQYTRDHSIPGTNLVLQGLGWGGNPECGVHPYQAGDVVLLCSDGLSNALLPQTIGHAILQGGTAGEIAQRLMNLARINPCDNTTLVVVKLA